MMESIVVLTHTDESSALTRASLEVVAAGIDLCSRLGISQAIGILSDDLTTISGEWQTSDDGHEWHRAFGMTYRRLGSESSPGW